MADAASNVRARNKIDARASLQDMGTPPEPLRRILKDYWERLRRYEVDRKTFFSSV